MAEVAESCFPAVPWDDLGLPALIDAVNVTVDRRRIYLFYFDLIKNDFIHFLFAQGKRGRAARSAWGENSSLEERERINMKPHTGFIPQNFNTDIRLFSPKKIFPR